MADVKSVFRWWLGWNVEKIERWLEAEESEGWNLSKVGAGGVWFTFTPGPARAVAYTVDYQTQVKPDYHQLLEDAGWALVGTVAGWHFWRASYAGARPEIYTDTESLIDRNKRQMWLLGLLLFVQLPSLNTTIRHAGSTLGNVLLSIQLLAVLALGSCLVRFVLANRKLRRRDHWHA